MPRRQICHALCFVQIVFERMPLQKSCERQRFRVHVFVQGIDIGFIILSVHIYDATRIGFKQYFAFGLGCKFVLRIYFGALKRGGWLPQARTAA